MHFDEIEFHEGRIKSLCTASFYCGARAVAKGWPNIRKLGNDGANNGKRQKTQNWQSVKSLVLTR